jgi:hypothetical protein
MPKKPRSLDLNENAFRVMRLATERHDPDAPKRPTAKKSKPKAKNPAAVALGRLGGLKGGPARAAKLSAKELSEQGRKAANARWADKDKG